MLNQTYWAIPSNEIDPQAAQRFCLDSGKWPYLVYRSAFLRNKTVACSRINHFLNYKADRHYLFTDHDEAVLFALTAGGRIEELVIYNIEIF